MASLSTHVLDARVGRPASGVEITLRRHPGPDDAPVTIATGSTDADGRIGALSADLEPGTYSLRFAVGDYFDRIGVPHFFPQVSIDFTIDADQHYHVPLLLSPYAYSTYRGS